jgi:hypothetical protein
VTCVMGHTTHVASCQACIVLMTDAVFSGEVRFIPKRACEGGTVRFIPKRACEGGTPIDVSVQNSLSQWMCNVCRATVTLPELQAVSIPSGKAESVRMIFERKCPSRPVLNVRCCGGRNP